MRNISDSSSAERTQCPWQVSTVSAPSKAGTQERVFPGIAWRAPNSSRQLRRKIRVLMVITRLTIGGDTTVLLEMAQRLNETGMFDVELAAGPVPDYEVDLTHLAQERAITVHLIPSLINHISPVTNLRCLLELRALMQSGRYDIVHTHSSVAGVVGRLVAATARIPIIVHHVHGWGLREDMPAALKLLYLNLERLCARFTTRLIAVSQPTIEKGLQYKVCGQDKFSLIYNGIRLADFRQPLDRQATLQALGLNAECPTVGMIGRLDAQKNPLDFIRAAGMVVERCPNVQFLIVGEGRLRPDCEQLIESLKLKGHVVLLGFRQDVNKILPLLDIAVSTSLWEGLPLVLQEAMSAGKPIVANNVDGVGDAVMEGMTGYLVEAHHPEQIAERIQYLLTDDDLRSRMGELARQASERFSTEQMVKNVADLYFELLAGRAVKPALSGEDSYEEDGGAHGHD